MDFAFSAVVFDLDGTLSDSVGDIGASMNHALALHGLAEHSRTAYEQMVGEGLETLARRAVPANRHDDIASILSAYRDHYAVHFADTSRPYPGVPELLDALTARSVPMAVLSNKRDDFTKKFVAAVLPRWRFAIVLGERTGVPRKPDPAAALEIAQSLVLAPADLAFVGDTRIDMQTATAAGMYAVGVSWGMRGRAELWAHGARAVLDRPEQLLSLRPEG